MATVVRRKRPRASRWLILVIILAVLPTVAAQEQSPVQSGQRLFWAVGCYGCHTVGSAGTPIGPDLSHVGTKYSETYLVQWLGHPAAQRPTAHMPRIALEPGDAAALAAFLASLR